jgi:hypothetical protein
LLIGRDEAERAEVAHIVTSTFCELRIIFAGDSLMNPASRLFRELHQLSNHVSPLELGRYLSHIAQALPIIVRGRTLAPADCLMTHEVTFRYKGCDIIVPIDRVTEILKGKDETPTFGGMREMYSSNVYLRAFREGIPMDIVVDLGSNRGLFCLLALTAYRASIAIGVEPVSYFRPVLDLLLSVNCIDPIRAPREEKLIASVSGQDKITMEEILKKYKIGRIDFLKCDIEGGEFDIILRNSSFLEAVSNLAMEVHPAAGDYAALSNALERHGFALHMTDQFGAPIDNGSPHYLYASRTGDLMSEH